MLVHFAHEHKKTFLSDLFFKGKSPGESEVHQLGSSQKVNQKSKIIQGEMHQGTQSVPSKTRLFSLLYKSKGKEQMENISNT